MEKTEERRGVKMANLTYVVTDGASYTPICYTVKAPECCKQFFDWLCEEGIVDGACVTMEQIATNKIAFEVKEKK